jgi:hypothetical protein
MRGPAIRWHAVVRRVVLRASVLVFASLPLGVARAAYASSSPTAYTGEASQVTSSSATLKGSVNPSNESTNYYFQYGQTSAYGSQTPTVSVGAGTQTVHVTAAITGLSVGTIYHYRLLAVNAQGTVDGQDRTFATKKIPLAIRVVATPSRDLFGSPFSIEGTLSGTGSVNAAVVLQVNPFPYLIGFKTIGNPELTNADGGFSFSVPGLSQNTQLRVATVGTPKVTSGTLLERVAVLVTLHLRPAGRHGYARLYGTVTPGESGAQVGFQLLSPGHRPKTVSTTLITGGTPTVSRFSRIVRIRHAGLYRAVVWVVSGAQVSNRSRAILIG